MKAAVCRSFGAPLEIENVEIAAPERGEIKVELAACAICHSDIHAINGEWGGDLPTVYGHEAAGVVSEIGAGVSEFSVGDHVVVSLLRSCGHCFHCGQGAQHLCETKFHLDQEPPLTSSSGETIKQGIRTGAFAEYALVEQSQAVAIPKDIPLDSASLLACGVITGLGAVVNTAGVSAGCSVAVIGAGGVGLNSVQGAGLSGAHPVIAIDLAEEKLETAKSFGATHGLNAADNELAARVRDLTGGRGVDYAFVTVGSPRAIEQAVTLVRVAGTVCIVGMPAEGAKIELEGVDIPDMETKIIGSKMGSTQLRRDVPKLVELYRSGRLKLDELITGRYKLDQINDAISDVGSGTTLRNVIIF